MALLQTLVSIFVDNLEIGIFIFLLLSTGYWKTNSIKYNFLLLAHEYLFIFEKGLK